MIWKALLLFLLCNMISFIAWGEYRVFTLVFKDSEGNILRELNSNLDPDQYRAFYPVANDQTLIYVDTWMCRGRTNQLPICPNPKLVSAETQLETSPSDQNPPPP